jgi:hypothetical protein
MRGLPSQDHIQLPPRLFQPTFVVKDLRHLETSVSLAQLPLSYPRQWHDFVAAYAARSSSMA